MAAMIKSEKSIPEENPSLFHYTSQAGLEGILASQTIFATHYKFLNDATEIEHFKSALAELLEQKVFAPVKKRIKALAATSDDSKSNLNAIYRKHGGETKAIKKQIASQVNTIFRLTCENAYIASFCGWHPHAPRLNQHGLLSQWRAYGHDGGFALEFDTKALNELFKEDGNLYDDSLSYFGNCFYDEDPKKIIAKRKAEFDFVGDFLVDFADALATDQRRLPDAAQAAQYFFALSSQPKHPGFSEENEVRIATTVSSRSDEVIDGEPLRTRQIKFRNTAGVTVPYIELFAGLNKRLPIKRILVGPHVDRDKRAVYVRSLLRDLPIEVTVSDIPYIAVKR
ncbi:MAG: DUF2971 domain-containing protein [Rhodospirillaceae bacterium]|nr:MAG: DUF2971 domain-containing protein [Rhodospirillaceae bacterium]